MFNERTGPKSYKNVKYWPMNLTKRNFWAILTILVLILLSCSLKRPGYQTDNTIFDTTLNNDLDVVLKPWPAKLVSVQFWLRCGSLQETERTNGLAHFLEHMIFKKKDLVSEIEARGGYFNAATSHDFTYYYVTVPSTQVKFVIKALGELLFNNDFKEADFLKEQKVILEEIDRAGQDPDNQMYYSIARTVYGDHPYGREVLGKKKNMTNYKLTDLSDF
jgi:predicted Zn-dependent peptidase